MSTLLEDETWFEGPKFLKLQPNQWPNQFLKDQSYDEKLVQNFDLSKKR